MPSLVVLQNAHNEISTFTVDETARHLHYGNESEPSLLQTTKCSLCSDWICNALSSQTNTRDATSAVADLGFYKGGCQNECA